MSALISWLSRHRKTTVLLTATYSVLVIAGHGWASAIADWVSEALGREVFNAIISAMLLLAALLTGIFLCRRLERSRRARTGLFFLCATMLAAFLAYHTLLVTNVESIHFVQYALLAVPFFALVRCYGAAVLLTTLVGVADEIWQYLWLYRDRTDVYFDFNDIILNIIGAGIGVTLVYLSRVASDEQGEHTSSVFVRKQSLWLPTACGILLALMIATGLIQVFPAEAAATQSLLLSRGAAPETFWTPFPWGKTYHLLHPFEGLLIAQVLLLFYGLLDEFRGHPP